MEECVAAFQSEQAWSRNSIEQVRTAVRLFDFACGGNMTIQGITKDHVGRFREVCEALPNRWVSIGVQKGPPIGVQKRPPSSGSVTVTDAPFALVAA